MRYKIWQIYIPKSTGSTTKDLILVINIIFNLFYSRILWLLHFLIYYHGLQVWLQVHWPTFASEKDGWKLFGCVKSSLCSVCTSSFCFCWYFWIFFFSQKILYKLRMIYCYFRSICWWANTKVLSAKDENVFKKW